MEIVQTHAPQMVSMLQATILEDDFEMKKDDERNTLADSKPQQQQVATAVQSYLDSKASYQMSLLLGYLRMPHSEILGHILTVNTEKLGRQTLSSLRDFVPSKEVMTNIVNHVQQNDISTLSQTDQLFYQLRNVTRLQERFACWSFCSTYSQVIVTATPDIDLLGCACEEVMNSKQFKNLLSVRMLVQ